MSNSGRIGRQILLFYFIICCRVTSVYEKGWFYGDTNRIIRDTRGKQYLSGVVKYVVYPVGPNAQRAIFGEADFVGDVCRHHGTSAVEYVFV